MFNVNSPFPVGSTWSHPKCMETHEANLQVSARLESNHTWKGEIATAGIKLFDKLQKNVLSLFGSSNYDDKALCTTIFEDIKTLIDFTEITLKTGETYNQRLNTELLHVHRELAAVTQNLNSSRAQLGERQATLTGLNQKKKLLKEECDRNKELIEACTKKKEYEEEVRLNAAVDLIPFVGLIGGICTGNYKRMIPFYSQGAGLVSVICGELGDCERQLTALLQEQVNLNAEIGLTTAGVQCHEKDIDTISSKIADLKLDADLKDDNIKQLGRDLTAIRNINQSLKQILCNCHFLKTNITVSIEYVEVVGETGQDDVQGLIDTIKSTQATFNEIFMQKIKKVGSLAALSFNS